MTRQQAVDYLNQRLISGNTLNTSDVNALYLYSHHVGKPKTREQCKDIIVHMKFTAIDTLINALVKDFKINVRTKPMKDTFSTFFTSGKDAVWVEGYS